MLKGCFLKLVNIEGGKCRQNIFYTLINVYTYRTQEAKNIEKQNPAIMVFKNSQADFEAVLATFVIGDLNRKSERSN